MGSLSNEVVGVVRLPLIFAGVSVGVVDGRGQFINSRSFSREYSVGGA